MTPKTRQIGIGWKNTTPSGKECVNVIITNPIGLDYHFTLCINDRKQKDGDPDYSFTKQADERPAATAARRDTSFPSDAPAEDDEVPF